MSENETLENEVLENETLEGEATEGSNVEATVPRAHVSDDDFFMACEEVAASDNPSIEAIAARVGLKPASVTQRRGLLNKRFKDEGLNIQLTPLPRGGGRQFDAKTAADRLREIQASIKARKEAGKTLEDVEREIEQRASE
jgi:hypothetical protein